MLELKVTTIKKAKSLIQEEKIKSRKHRKKSPIIEEYEGYLNKLERGKAIAITLKEGDKYQTIKYRLSNAAKSLGIKNLKIERSGNKIVFYKQARPRTRRIGQPEAGVWTAYKSDGEQQPLYEFKYEPEPEFEPAPPESPGAQPAFAPAPADDLTAMQSPDPMPGQEEELLEFDFDEEWEEPLVHGHKTCETTIGKYPDNTFEAFDHQYVVTKVEQLPLGEVQQKWFKQHGLFSPREFQEVWKQHHHGTFDPEQKVWLHQFQRGFPPSTESDADGYPE